VEVTIANLDRMVMPATVELVWKDGTRQRVSLPVETWLQGGLFVLKVGGFPDGQVGADVQGNAAGTNGAAGAGAAGTGHGMLISVTIDPDKVLPDVNRENNSWKP
jgi:hypothetical protein